MPGIPGQYFRQFGLTVAIAVLFSLLVARLITPMMAAYLMRAKDAAAMTKTRRTASSCAATSGWCAITTKVRRSKQLPWLALADLLHHAGRRRSSW